MRPAGTPVTDEARGVEAPAHRGLRSVGVLTRRSHIHIFHCENMITVERAFAALGDSVRLRIGCCLLMAPDGLCVCELVDVLGEPQPNVSRQLKLLKEAGRLPARPEGRWAYYALRPKDHPLLKPLTADRKSV